MYCIPSEFGTLQSSKVRSFYDVRLYRLEAPTDAVWLYERAIACV